MHGPNAAPTARPAERLTAFALERGLRGHVHKTSAGYEWLPERGAPQALGRTARKAEAALRGLGRRRRDREGAALRYAHAGWNPPGDDASLRRFERAHLAGRLDPESEASYMSAAWRAGPAWPWVEIVSPPSKRSTLYELAQAVTRDAYADLTHYGPRWGWVERRLVMEPHAFDTLTSNMDASYGGAPALAQLPPAGPAVPLEGFGGDGWATRWTEVTDGRRIAYLAKLPLGGQEHLPPAMRQTHVLSVALPKGFREEDYAPVQRTGYRWAADLAQEALGEDHAASRAMHAKAIRAVLKAAKVPGKAVSITTPHHSMASALYVKILRPSWAATVNELLGTRFMGREAGESDYLHPTHREGRSDPYTDYYWPAGVQIPSEFHATYKAAIKRARKQHDKREAGREARAKARRDPSQLPGQVVARAPLVGDELRLVSKGVAHERWLLTDRVDGRNGVLIQAKRLGKRGQVLASQGNTVYYRPSSIADAIAKGRAQLVQLDDAALAHAGKGRVKREVAAPATAPVPKRPKRKRKAAPKKASGDYAKGLKAGRAEARGMTPQAARAYLDMVGAPRGDFDRGHQDGLRERASRTPRDVASEVLGGQLAELEARGWSAVWAAPRGAPGRGRQITGELPGPQISRLLSAGVDLERRELGAHGAAQTTLWNPPHRRIKGRRSDGRHSKDWERYKAATRPTGQIQRAKKRFKTETAAWRDVRKKLKGIRKTEVVPAHTRAYWRWVWAPGGQAAAGKRARARAGNPLLATVGNPGNVGVTTPYLTHEVYEFDAETIAQLPNGAQALERYRMLHNGEPGAVLVVQTEGGPSSPKVVVGVGYSPEEHYFVDAWEGATNKEGPLWVHEYPEGQEPVLILDPATGLLTKLPLNKDARVTDWLRK